MIAPRAQDRGKRGSAMVTCELRSERQTGVTNVPHQLERLWRPRVQPCAQCGAELDYYDAEDGEEAVCSQCSCLLAGCCDACDGECRGWAWPQRH